MEAVRGEDIYHTETLRSIVDSAIVQHTKQVIGDEKRRSDECMQELQQILVKYDCAIVPRAVISPQGIEFQIETVPRVYKADKSATKGAPEDATNKRQEPQGDRQEHRGDGGERPPA